MKLPTYQDLSKEQDRVNNFPLQGSYLIAGPPGTGKTVLALYRANMLTKKGASSVLLMHSRLLLQYTAAAVKALGIDGSVHAFHSWLWSLYWKLFGRKPPLIAQFTYDWVKILSKLNETPPADNRVPYLLIDEAQDLPKFFFPVARLLARHLTIFADENQRLQEDNSSIEDIASYSQISEISYLTRNYRNTHEIAALAAHFYTGLPTGIPELPTRHGEKPVMMHHADLQETVAEVLRFESNNADLHIGVFTPTTSLRNKLVFRLKDKTKNLVQTYAGGQGPDGPIVDFIAPGIKVVTYQSSKGLEFDAVFLPELQQIADDPDDPVLRMRFYVLISRARHRLFLSYSGPEPSRAVQMFPKDLVEWR